LCSREKIIITQRRIKMNKLTKRIIPALLAILVLLPVSQGNEVSAASQYENGEYSVSLTVLKGDSDEASVANDFISSKAKVIVADGTNTVQITVTQASMLKSLKIGTSEVKEISSDGETAVLEFKTDDLDQV